MSFSKPSFILFCSSLILSTFLILSSSNLIIIWIRIELNLLSFVPILINDKTRWETESTIKYFLAQAIGSAIVLSALISINLFPAPPLIPMSSFLLFLGLLIKIGFPPFHFWIPHTMQGATWINCLILRTLQKIAPMTIIWTLFSSYFSSPSVLLLVVGAIVGRMGGLNQTQIRPLLAYSSISHMAWIIAVGILSLSVALVYLLIYIIISTALILGLRKHEIKLFPNTSSIKLSHITAQTPIILCLLSLGGLPPLRGFFPKWLSVDLLTSRGFNGLALILLSSALINLFFYLRLSFNLLNNNHPVKVSYAPQPLLASSLAIATLPLAPAVLLLLLYAMNLLNKS